MKNKFWTVATISVGLMLSASSCNDGEDTIPVADLRSLADAQGLTGDASTGRNLPDISSPLAQLGMQLFFSKSLGGDGDAACVTCHHPLLGGGDDLSLPIGVAADDPDLLGPGRAHASGQPSVPRNAPTTFNIGLWDRCLFWDCRVESLGKTPGVNGNDGSGIRTPDSGFGVADPFAGENLTQAQARFPITSGDEMRGFTFEAGNSNDSLRDHLAARLSDSGIGAGEIGMLNGGNANGWGAAFQTVFGNNRDPEVLINHTTIAAAIGAYERSQVFVNNPWKAFLQGDSNALTPSQKRGAELFLKSREDGGAACVSCHRGDLFSGETFYVMATPQFGHGKGDGPNGDDDFGRERETKNAANRYQFRVPTLLNVAKTGPYGHNGAYDTLEDMVRHHLNPTAAVNAYFDGPNWCHKLDQFDDTFDCDGTYPNAEANTRLALAQLQTNRDNNVPRVLQTVNLNDSDVNAVVDFLHALTDPCLDDIDCIGAWIPQGAGPDSLQLNANDRDGNPIDPRP